MTRWDPSKSGNRERTETEWLVLGLEFSALIGIPSSHYHCSSPSARFYLLRMTSLFSSSMRSKKLEGLRSNGAVSQASGMAKYLLVLRVLIFISSVSRGLCVQETLGSNCRLHLDWIYGPLFLSAFRNMSAECARCTDWLSFLPTPKIKTTSNGVRSTTIYSCLLNGRFWTNSTPNFSKYKSIIAVQYIASCLFNISWKYKGVRSHSMDRAKWNRNGTALTLVKVLARCKRRREREREREREGENTVSVHTFFSSSSEPHTLSFEPKLCKTAA